MGEPSRTSGGAADDGQVFAPGPRSATATRGGHAEADPPQVPRPRSSSWRAILRTLRPHQWVKNTLLFLPAMAAHMPRLPETAPALLAGFVAFSLVASATYILNDLIDLPSDRLHASKRRRPIAAGELSVRMGLLLAALLVVAGGLIAFRLPLAFQAVLATYLVLTIAYSLTLKKRPILDVITLATLYASRVVAGAALVSVPLSRWFLAFSVFFFFSLALLKRVIELGRRSAEGDTSTVPGRGYGAGDIPVLTSLGTTAVMASALVYCLYITSEEVGALYSRSDLLWLGLPILLFWQSRLWLFVGRNALDDDPVVFALKDRMSRACFGVFLLVVWLAAR